MQLTSASGRPVDLVVSTGSFWPLGTLAATELIRAVPHRSVEWTLQANEFRIRLDGAFDEAGLNTLTDGLSAAGLRVHSLHGPYINADHAHSLAARLTYLERAVRHCHDLGGTVVTTHPSHLFTTHEAASGYLHAGYPRLSEALLPGVDRVFRLAERLGVTIALENIRVFLNDGTGLSNVADNLLRFVDDAHSPAVGATLDVIHATLGAVLDEMLARLAPYIACVQLSDMDASRNRVPLGRGLIPWATLVPALASFPALQVITLELAHATPDDVRDCVDVVKRFWPSATTDPGPNSAES
jgi:sugar phosphate isomerase/epimerase